MTWNDLISQAKKKKKKKDSTITESVRTLSVNQSSLSVSTSSRVTINGENGLLPTSKGAYIVRHDLPYTVSLTQLRLGEIRGGGMIDDRDSQLRYASSGYNCSHAQHQPSQIRQ